MFHCFNHSLCTLCILSIASFVLRLKKQVGKGSYHISAIFSLAVPKKRCFILFLGVFLLISAVAHFLCYFLKGKKFASADIYAFYMSDSRIIFDIVVI